VAVGQSEGRVHRSHGNRGPKAALPAGRPSAPATAGQEGEARGGTWVPPAQKMHRAGDAAVRLPTDRRRSAPPVGGREPQTFRTRCDADSTTRCADESRYLVAQSYAKSVDFSMWKARGDYSPLHAKAPNRFRLRPAFRSTAAEATAGRRAFNLGRSVLGAGATLGGLECHVKARNLEKPHFA
jgi:hypothetical protein